MGEVADDGFSDRGSIPLISSNNMKHSRTLADEIKLIGEGFGYVRFVKFKGAPNGYSKANR